MGTGILDVPGRVLRNGSNHRSRGHGGKDKIYRIPSVQHLYQRTDLSGFRKLGMGKSL